MTDFDIIIGKLKKIWLLAVIGGTLILAGSNLLAQKLFFQDQLSGMNYRLTVLEKKRKADDSTTTAMYNKYLVVLQRIEFNLQEKICPKLGITYSKMPKVFDDE